MVIERMRLSQVEDAFYNPRKDLTPSDPEWRQIEASLNEFGLVEPLVYNRATGRLVGGHQRKKILQARGETEAFFSVVDLDEAKERALNVALNRGGDWNEIALADLLTEIRELDADMLSVTGYDDAMIEQLIAGAGSGPEIEPPMPEGETAPDQTSSLPAIYQVLVTCESERAQLALLERLVSDGFSCRAQLA